MALIGDSFPTTITFAGLSGATFKEKEITPLGASAGGPINRTGMRNTALRTASPKVLKTITGISLTVNYASALLPLIFAYIGVNDVITVTWPDGHGFNVYGWCDSFQPHRHVEGTETLADMMVEVSNLNTSGVEVAPVYF